MKIVDKAYAESHKSEILEAVRNGKIFIYPTDTIYGLGCNAFNGVSVRKIREIKNREIKPFSIIAPDKNWIENNCVVDKEVVDKFLPGPYTLVVKTKKPNLAPEINPIDDTLGVRIPKHWFSEIIQEAGIPFVTTSVNLSGEKYMESMEDINTDILEQVDYVVYEGEKKGEPSEKINLL